MNSNTLYITAYNQIKKSKRILLTTHDRPDGDAVASVCLMANILDELKIPYEVFCLTEAPKQFNYLGCVEKFSTELKTFDYDLIIALDCGSVKRTNLAEQIKNRGNHQFFIEFDHHLKTENASDLEIRDSGAASTTEVLYYFARANNIKISKTIANCVLTGIITDTANFLYPATSSETINIASEMLSHGARLPLITENTWRNKSIASMKTWGKAMSNLQINPKYNFAYTVLKTEDIAEEVSEEELDGMAGFLSNLNDVKGVLLLRELKDGRIKGSLRASKSSVNVADIAKEMGGGGHIRASGFTVEGRLEQTEKGWKII